MAPGHLPLPKRRRQDPKENKIYNDRCAIKKLRRPQTMNRED